MQVLVWRRRRARTGGTAQANLGSQASTAAGSAISIMDVITGALLVTLPVVVLFILVRRHWAAGLLTGSLQGQ
jgi:ABC-type glycerol-3-phosphate transport system permease component